MSSMTAPDETLYARDLDGTGSPHICSKGDPGAHHYYREDLALPSEAEQLLKASFHALRSYEHGNASSELAKGIADLIDQYLGRVTVKLKD